MSGSSNSRVVRAAWVDEDDEGKQGATRALPDFLRASHKTPAWATAAAATTTTRTTAMASARRARDGDDVAATTTDAPGGDDDGEANAHVVDVYKKRFRNDDVDALLSRTTPLIATDVYGGSSSDDAAGGATVATSRRVPTMLSVLPLPRDAARTLHWLRHGQLVVVGGNRHVYTFHAAGRFVEQLCKVDVRSRVETTALCAGEEQVVVAPHEAYTPQLLTLATEQLTALSFLDTRSSSGSGGGGVYHGNARSDTRKAESYIAHLATPSGNVLSSSSMLLPASVVAVTHGRTVTLGSLSSGSVVTRIAADDVVSDVHFTTPTQLLVASGCTLCVYDVRKTSAHLLRRVVDTAAVHISAVAVSPSSTVAVGTSSGVVHVYTQHDYSKPARVLKNLTTCIHHICLGSSNNNSDGRKNSSSSHAGDVLAFASRSEKAAFRLVHLPEGGVVPSFPAVSMRHSFVQSLTLSPTLPILSVGERQKVTNYAM